MIYKFDNIQTRREDNFEKYIANEKASEYTREKKLELFFEKMRKIDEFK